MKKRKNKVKNKIAQKRAKLKQKSKARKKRAISHQQNLKTFSNLMGMNYAPVSARILDLVQPLLDNSESFEERKGIVELGIMAWNLSIFEKNAESYGKEEFIKNAYETLGIKEEDDDFEDTIALIFKVAELKQNLFPSDKRVVVDYVLEIDKEMGEKLTTESKLFEDYLKMDPGEEGKFFY